MTNIVLDSDRQRQAPRRVASYGEHIAALSFPSYKTDQDHMHGGSVSLNKQFHGSAFLIFRCRG